MGLGCITHAWYSPRVDDNHKHSILGPVLLDPASLLLTGCGEGASLTHEDVYSFLRAALFTFTGAVSFRFRLLLLLLLLDFRKLWG